MTELRARAYTIIGSLVFYFMLIIANVVAFFAFIKLIQVLNIF